MKITEVTEVTNDIVAAFERLVPQLSCSRHPPSREQLIQIVRSPATILLVAHNRDHPCGFLGTLTLVLFRIPSGLRAWIEDVVVDANARGEGVGEALCRAAIQRGTGLGATTVDLTSRPSREVANQLYQRLGFVKLDTNVYRYTCTNVA